jgi:hypothetical protein
LPKRWISFNIWCGSSLKAKLQLWKKKGKVPLCSIEVHLGSRRYNSYFFLTLALEGMSGQHHALATLYPQGNSPSVPLV